jgi:hypothetical protein
MTEKKAQSIVEGFFNPLLSVKNVYMFYNGKHELDYLGVRRSDHYTFEVEIKVSKWDYLKDQKKVLKHGLLEKLYDVEQIPNYFWYCLTEPIYNYVKKHEEIPDYAGMAVVTRANTLRIVKKAEILHRVPFEDWKQIAIKLHSKQ